MVAASGARSGSAKLRALIASDQVILQSLPPGSLAATQLDTRIQAAVTVYTSGLVLPNARRNAAFMGFLWSGCLAVALTWAWKNHSSAGDQFVYSFTTGFFAGNVSVCLRVLFHRNRLLVTLEDAARADQAVTADDGDSSSPAENAASYPSDREGP